MNALAIIPARSGSKGVPNKNFRALAGVSPVARAASCAKDAGCYVVVSSDATIAEQLTWGCNADAYHMRALGLATDDAPMVDVVRDVLANYGGDLIVLVQPTQPLRRAEHLTAAIKLLEDSGADSVVSVVQLPPTHHPLMQLGVSYLTPGGHAGLARWYESAYATLPERRQELAPTYIRDGTAYCFRRSTVARFGNIYGDDVYGLIIDPSETCPLDTPEDWAEAERRLTR